MDSPFGYVGGKSRVAKKLLTMVDAIPHRQYVEVFGGSASLLFAKRPAKISVYNDADERLADFFRVLADDEKREILKRYAATFPCSRAVFREMKTDWINSSDIVKRAFATFYVQTFSFGGTYFGSFSISTIRGRDRVQAYRRRADRLDAYAESFRDATVEALDYRELLRRYDSPETLFYCDPPYLCSRKTFYREDLPKVDHCELVETILNVSGNVVLSCYAHDVYAPLANADWERFDFKTTSSVAGDRSNPERVETVYVKRQAMKGFLDGF